MNKLDTRVAAMPSHQLYGFGVGMPHRDVLVELVSSQFSVPRDVVSKIDYTVTVGAGAARETGTNM